MLKIMIALLTGSLYSVEVEPGVVTPDGRVQWGMAIM